MSPAQIINAQRNVILQTEHTSLCNMYIIKHNIVSAPPPATFFPLPFITSGYKVKQYFYI